MSYYNPFMPTRHLHPRSYGLMVFGGGGGGPAPADVSPTFQHGGMATQVIDRGEALVNPGNNLGEMAPEARERFLEMVRQQKAQQPDVTIRPNAEFQTPSMPATGSLGNAMLAPDGSFIPASGFQPAPDAAPMTYEQATMRMMQQDVKGPVEQAQIQAAIARGRTFNYTYEEAVKKNNRLSQNVLNPDEQAAVDAAIAKGPAVEPLTAEAKAEAEAAAVAAGQRDLVKKAITDPASLSNKQDVSTINPDTVGTVMAPTAGAISGTAPTAATTTSGGATAATAPTDIAASTVGTATGQPAVAAAVADTSAPQGTLSDGSTVTAASMTPTDTAVSNLVAAKGEAIVLNNPVTRDIQAGEIITGAADATAAAAFTEQVQAATATPSTQATVQGQLTELMSDFDGGATPSWAAGAMRSATAQMAARGLGASSMAGQALVQAAMEAALPIAASDAQTVAGFEMANLSNRQQRAMLAAQQRASFMGQEFDQAFQARVQNASRVSDAANMNFTAEQQVALENSRNANTINMANLTNTQAMLMGEAAAISGLELQNLSNQQQAAVQNAQTFLQMDMTNLNNLQQTEMFKAQSVIQSIFTDQAAENAAKQFNASSENQTKQFMSNMKTQVNQFNTSQSNAISQFDASETNAIAKFNSDMRNQRDQFNSTNQLVIAQANAQWRQSVATTDTTAQNVANAEAAKASNAFTASTIDQIWQRERDLMSMAWKSSESAGDRANNIILSQMGADAQRESINMQTEANESAATGGFFSKLLFYGLTGGGSIKK